MTYGESLKLHDNVLAILVRLNTLNHGDEEAIEA
jgi:hypothetical protein